MLLDSVGNRDGRSRGWEEGTEFDDKTQISVPASATVRLAEIRTITIIIQIISHQQLVTTHWWDGDGV